LDEFRNVLIRDFCYVDKEIDNLFQVVLQIVNLVTPVCNLNIIKDDKEDNKILECAVESESEFILTYDNHLLILKEYECIRIMKPEDFISSVRF
jgi:putative PIN family toxin of toxin-antitoxin system